MPKTNEQVTLRCKQCGTLLTEENSWERVDGVSCDCADCEQAFYDKLAEQMGFSLALYLCCVRYNVPCEPMLIPDNFKDKDFEGNEARWQWYLETLADSDKYLSKDGAIRGFGDGVKSMFRIFGREMSEKDFARYCLTEKERLGNLPGTEEQRQRWGTRDIWSGFPITTAVYNELDQAYEDMKSRYRGVTIDETMDTTIKRIVKLRLAQDFLQSKGEAASFDKVQKSINSILEAEQLRKKDEKPIENFRPDAWIDAFEKSGIMQDKQFLPWAEVSEKLIDIMKGQGYPQTLDAAYQFEMNVLNNARKNSNQQSIYELPKDMRITDGLDEFAPNEGEEERSAKEYAHLTKVHFEKNESED